MMETDLPAPDPRQLARRYAHVPPGLYARLLQFRSRYSGRHATVAGTDWRYLDSGPAGETPLLVLTGAACLAEMSWRSIEHFARRRRVIAPDYPPLNTMAELVDGIVTVLDQAGVERTHVLGGSYGGFVAQAFVRRHPDRTVSLILSHALLPDREGAITSPPWMSFCRPDPAATAGPGHRLGAHTRPTVYVRGQSKEILREGIRCTCYPVCCSPCHCPPR